MDTALLKLVSIFYYYHLCLFPFWMQDDSTEFLARDDYHSCFNTYEVDEDYVKYCEELPKKIKVSTMWSSY